MAQNFLTRAAAALGLAKAPNVVGFALPITGGFIPSSWPWNFWQQGRDPVGSSASPIVQACIATYAQTVASLPARHVSEVPGEGVKVISTSPLSRVLRAPNPYQTPVDFFSMLTADLFGCGNAFAACIRDDRHQVIELHPLPARSVIVHVAHHDDGDPATFYAIPNLPLLPASLAGQVIPARDLLHLRINADPRAPLRGRSPVEALAAQIASTNAIAAHQAAFFSNMSRPSGLLTTDERITKEQMMQLRDAWQNQSQQLNSGGVPILASGLKWQTMSITSQDSQLVEAYGLGVEEIARAFRIPLPLIGNLSGASQYGTIADLASLWAAQGLGSVLQLIEASFGGFFGLPTGTRMDLDESALLRADPAGRADILVKLVGAGVMSPNEARRSEGLPDAEFGDEPRVLQQMVPLSAATGTTTEAPVADIPAPAPEERALLPAPSDTIERRLRLIAGA
ncbi:phage portal protein [Paracoccus litorisediminis]|uniref:phage portal protein n=1 Tax=Paracoccus litorisediminis TaxID=2006130 RepID=UPI003731EF2B